ncbi:MAG: hypothetical protein IJW43_01225 [Clostridia bacterium]|nr:hypothetical protein [Clostridia bacterium]
MKKLFRIVANLFAFILLSIIALFAFSGAEMYNQDFVSARKITMSIFQRIMREQFILRT